MATAESIHRKVYTCKPTKASHRPYPRAGLLSIIFLILVPQIATQPAHRTFEFRVQFKATDPLKKNRSLTVERGSLLSAISRTGGANLVFQPIVLCEDIQINFKDNLTSDWVNLKGFCPTPGVPVAPGDAYLQLTPFYHTDIRRNGCDVEAMTRVRSQTARSYNKELAVFDIRFPCGPRSEQECLDFLNGKPEFRGLGGTIQEHLRAGTCKLVAELEGTARVWVAYCDSKGMDL